MSNLRKAGYSGDFLCSEYAICIPSSDISALRVFGAESSRSWSAGWSRARAASRCSRHTLSPIPCGQWRSCRLKLQSAWRDLLLPQRPRAIHGEANSQRRGQSNRLAAIALPIGYAGRASHWPSMSDRPSPWLQLGVVTIRLYFHLEPKPRSLPRRALMWHRPQCRLRRSPSRLPRQP